MYAPLRHQAGDHVMDQGHESHTVRGRVCKVDVAEPRTWGFELFVLLRPQRWGGRRHCLGAIEQFLTAALFCSCELQVSAVCLMSSIWATSDAIIRRSSWMRTLALWMWSSSVRRCRGTRSSSVRYNCSSGFKRFYPFVNASLTHAVNITVLC